MEVTSESSDSVCSCCASPFSNTHNDAPTPAKEKGGENSENKVVEVEFPELGQGNDPDEGWPTEETADLKWRPEQDSSSVELLENQVSISSVSLPTVPATGINRNQNDMHIPKDSNASSLRSEVAIEKSSPENFRFENPVQSSEAVSDANDKENVSPSPSSQKLSLPTFSKDRITEMLALLFEYPYIVRKEKTLFNSEEDLIFCAKCEKALSNLYNVFRDFMELLKAEGKVCKILRRVGNEPEPLLPLLVYDTESQNENDYERKSLGKTRGRKLARGLKQNEDNRQDGVNQRGATKVGKVRRNIRKRQEQVSVIIETDVEEVEEEIAGVTDRSEDSSGSENDNPRETDEEFDPDHNDDGDDSDDPTFSPKKKGQTERKAAELKRRGRKPQWSKQTSSAEYDASDAEPARSSPKRKKRIRNLKKEFWIDKAKNDPSRTCDICGKAFLYARMMQHHKSTVHEGKKPYECEFCGRGFTQNFILKKHTCDYSLAGGDREFLRIAREEQLFKWVCEVCGKRFKERSSLAVHQKNHTGETYKCDKCDKTFRRPDHLKTHVKIVHSDEKRFVCITCGQRFKTSSNLRAHERKHANPDQKHLCNICGKSIKTLSQMGRHQKTHEDVLPFECHICGKRFKMKDYLGQHLRKGKSCAMRVNRSKPTPADTSTSESHDFSMIPFQSSDSHNPPEDISFPVRDEPPLPPPIEYHYGIQSGTDCGMLTNL